MATYDLVARLRLIDNMTKPLKNATTGLDGMNGVASKVTKTLAGIGTAIGGVALVKNSISKAMDFESQMSSVGALTGRTKEELAPLNELAKELGARTKYSALEAAQGMEELVKAGMSVGQITDGALENALNLAAAGGLDLADAASIMSNALNAFSKEGLTSANVSDIMAKTANNAATTVNELQYALVESGGMAATVGMSFADVNTALGLMANKGITGSRAGTGLKNVLTRLIPASDTAAGVMEDLGLIVDGNNQFFDKSTGKMKDLKSISKLLKDSMSGLTDEQRQYAITTMFGMEALNSAVALYEAGGDGVEEFASKVAKAPSALEIASEKMNNAKGAAEMFRGALETLQIVAIEPLLPLFKDMLNYLTGLVEGFATWLQSDEAAEWGEAIKSAVGGALDIIKETYNFFKDNWTLIAPIIAGVTGAIVAYKAALMALRGWTILVNIVTAIWSGTLWANPITWIVALIGLLIGAIVLLVLNWDKCVDAMKKGWIGIQNVFIGGANAVIGVLNGLVWAYNKVAGVLGGTEIDSIGYLDFKTLEPDIPKLDDVTVPTTFSRLGNGSAGSGGMASQFGYTPNVSASSALSPTMQNVKNDNSVGAINMNVQIEGKQDDPKAMVDNIMKELTKRAGSSASLMGGK